MEVEFLVYESDNEPLSCRNRTHKETGKGYCGIEEGGGSNGLEHQGEEVMHLTRGCGQMPNARMETDRTE